MTHVDMHHDALFLTHNVNALSLTSVLSLYWILWCTGNQWRSLHTVAVVWSYFHLLIHACCLLIPNVQPVGCEPQLTWKCLFTPTFSSDFYRWSSLEFRPNWVLVCDHSLLLGLSMQDYNSLCAVVMICTIMVNINNSTRHTHTQHFHELMWIA